MSPRKPARRPPLSHERIVAAAAALVDREGAEALSARRLAFELGVEAMSLYHHVPSMQELLNQVVDQALGQIPLPAPDAGVPRKLLSAMLRGYLKLSEQRPHAFQVVSSRRWRTPAEFAYQARMVEILIAAGLTPRQALRGARLLVVYINGAGLGLVGWKLDTDKPPVQQASDAVKRVMRFSTLEALREDLESGLDLLLDAILAGR